MSHFETEKAEQDFCHENLPATKFSLFINISEALATKFSIKQPD